MCVPAAAAATPVQVIGGARGATGKFYEAAKEITEQLLRVAGGLHFFGWKARAPKVN